MLAISNLPPLDFIKIALKRLLRLDGIRWLFEVSSSIENWPDYYLVKFGLRQGALLHFRSGSAINANHQSFTSEVPALVDLEKLRKHAVITSLKDGYSIIIIQSGRFFVKRLVEVSVLLQTFVEKQYAELDVRGKVVIDIGANIGDSSIYFAKIGLAKKVIAFEPYPYSYELAKGNIALNEVQNIQLLNQGVGAKDTSIQLDPFYASTMRDDLKASKEGTRVKIVTLHDIIDSFGINSAVLKIDCEGCEYDVILNSCDQDLRCFDAIMIECHHGYANIENKLKSAGFIVKHSDVRYRVNELTNSRNHYLNFVYGTRSSNWS